MQQTTNPLQHAIDALNNAMPSYQDMKTDLMKAQDEARQQAEIIRDQNNQISFLKAELERYQRQSTMLQQYAVDLTTRLDVIVENIQQVKNEARRYGQKPVPVIQQPGAEDVDMEGEIKQLLQNRDQR